MAAAANRLRELREATEDDPTEACPRAPVLHTARPTPQVPGSPLPVVELRCHAPHPDPRRARARESCGKPLLGGNAIRGYVRCVLVARSRPAMQPVSATDEPRYIVAPCPRNSCGHWNVFELVDSAEHGETTGAEP